MAITARDLTQIKLNVVRVLKGLVLKIVLKSADENRNKIPFPEEVLGYKLGFVLLML